jgi:signal transduction histidine kinase
LPIVQRIVNAHGGEVSLHSESAGRTRALLRLPVFGKAQISDYATDDAGSG